MAEDDTRERPEQYALGQTAAAAPSPRAGQKRRHPADETAGDAGAPSFRCRWRGRTADNAAARMNHAADRQRRPRAPATKNAAIPSCAIVSAAAFRTDMNGSSVAEDRTTRT